MEEASGALSTEHDRVWRDVEHVALGAELGLRHELEAKRGDTFARPERTNALAQPAQGALGLGD